MRLYSINIAGKFSNILNLNGGTIMDKKEWSIEDWKKAKEKSDRKCKHFKKKFKRVQRKLKKSDYIYDTDKKKLKKKLKKYRNAYQSEKEYSDYLARKLEAAEEQIEIEKESMSNTFMLTSQIQELSYQVNYQKNALNFLVKELAPGLLAKYGKNAVVDVLPDKTNHSDDIELF